MTKVVNISEAQTHLKGLLALAKKGDEIIIEENGQMLGKITSSETQNTVSVRKKRRMIQTRSSLQARS